MSLLTIVQWVYDVTKLGEAPTAVMTSQDSEVRQLRGLLEAELETLTSRHAWPELQREFTLTLVNGQSEYDVPTYVRRWLHGTDWNRTEQERIHGPLTAQEWQQRKSGILDTAIREEWRYKWTDEGGKLVIHPTPDSSNAGQVLVWEVVTKEAIRPQQWITATAYSTGEYVYNAGNIYYAQAGGTSGATAPVHTSSTASDGSITWVYSSTPYISFTNDDDEILLDNHLVRLGLRYRHYRENGEEFESALQEYQKHFLDVAGARAGARTLCFRRPATANTIWEEMERFSIPITDYGT